MNKLISLIKTDLNITFGLSSIIYGLKAKKQRWQIVVFGIAMLSLLPTYIVIVNVLFDFYDVFKEIGQESYFLLMGFLASQLIIFFFGLMYVMSKYYFSNDLNQLLPLPIKPSHILTSKFISLMVSEYFTSLPIFLPFVIIYGIKESAKILYWIYAIVAFITLPILPLVLASIIIMILMKYTNIKGKRDFVRTITAVLLLVAIVYVQLLIQKISQQAILEGEDFYYNIARDANLLARNLGLVFPPSIWGTFALTNFDELSGLTNLIMFVGIGLAGFILMSFLSEKLFFDGLIGNIEVTASKGKGKKKDLDELYIENKAYISIAKKELKMLFKTPIYLLNTVGGVVLVPIILVMSLSIGDPSMEPFNEIIYSNTDIVTLVLIGVVAFFGIMNSVGSTTFSREGKNLWIQRTLPIKAKDQIYGRVLASVVIQLTGIITLLVSMFFIIKLNFFSLALIIVIGLLSGIVLTQFGMIIDILRPMLNWSSPQVAIKQNLNVLIGMGVALLYGGGIFLLVRFMFNSIDIWIIYLLVSAILTISMVILFNVLKTLIDKQFRELE
ncbi:MAG: hypothetical protein GX231_00525 [Tissierellia bacterium]|nr:hypothetical protein [Tissierellia bacterium]